MNLSVIDIFSDAGEITVRHWYAVAVFSLMPLAYERATVFVSDLVKVDFPAIELGASPSIGLIATVAAWVLLFALFEFLKTAAIACIVEDDMQGKGRRYLLALQKSATRVPAATFTSIVATVILLGLYLLLIVPGVIWSLYYTFFIQVVVVRGLSGKAALNYSKSLVEGQWWKVFWLLFRFGLITEAVDWLFGLFGDVGILGDIVYALWAGLVTTAFVVLFLEIDYARHGEAKETATGQHEPAEAL